MGIEPGARPIRWQFSRMAGSGARPSLSDAWRASLHSSFQEERSLKPGSGAVASCPEPDLATGNARRSSISSTPKPGSRPLGKLAVRPHDGAPAASECGWFERGEILERMGLNGDKTGEMSVSNALTRVDQGQSGEPQRWQIPGGSPIGAVGQTVIRNKIDSI